jgi:exo-beta-1,3-glucanase (GH17 family)
LNYAIANNMTVVIGVWVNRDDISNSNELTRLQEVLNRYASRSVITDIMVGNEAIFVQRASIDQLIGMVKSVRAHVDKATAASNSIGKISVGSADIDGIWLGNNVGSAEVASLGAVDMAPVIRACLDWIGVQLHPYYAGFEPTQGTAAKFVTSAANEVFLHWKAKGLERPVYVTETGFPSEGEPRTYDKRVSTPSLAGLEAFATDMELESRASELPVCTSSLFER